MTFELVPHPSPTPEDQIAEILKEPGFGTTYTDHTAVVDWRADGGWQNHRVEAYGDLQLSPASAVLHYAETIFEGLKAYKHDDGSVCTFRPDQNALRFQRSAARMALPQLPVETFVESLEQLLAQDKAWVPDGEGESLYLRPFLFADEPFLGVRPAQTFSYRVIASPAGNIFGGKLRPVKIWVSRDYVRAAPGGTGSAKTGGNYAGSLVAQQQAIEKGCDQVLFLDPLHENAVEELGGMNVFLVRDDNTLITPELTGTILEGITRDSIIQLAKDRGFTIEERRIGLAEWAEGAADGTITEAFACGTAAVVTPIGQLLDGEDTITMQGDFSVTMSLREELLGIQTGKVEDRHGWLHRLA
ncbi:branched-chain amino acid aminotransferase [Nesterenkonia populi]|uniref:branched-chain amino acid aminotransferase n=1 Tax=Nesterenkonia populi TaxID=1591087 RepID=UPI0011BE949D|nr:branched-chain amino acid aminotransferase [Nesterenkonia populi]